MKTKQLNYQIFISYRRSNGFETANLIADRLRNAGYSVFFDIESLKSGKFNEQLYQVIEDCTDFILVLPENGLDRCHNEGDWVRLETLHALENGKNIIPVMLKGFEWPEQMPEGMEELPKFQGVAANSYEHFDASIEKLKSYLKSKKGISIKRYKKQMLAFLFVLLVVAGLIGYKHYNNSKLFERVCNSESLLMGSEIVKMNVALDEANKVQEEWEIFLQKLAIAPPSGTASLKNDFIDYVDHCSSNAMEPTPGLGLSAESAVTLSLNGIKTEEIIAFYKITMPSFYEEVKDYYAKLHSYAEMKFIPGSIARNAKLTHNALGVSAKANYLGYLSLLSTMPQTVYNDEFYKVRKQLVMFSDIPLGQSYEQYESDMEVALQEYENIVLEMGGNVRGQELEVENMQNSFEELKKEVQNTIISEKVADINLKKAELDKKRAEYAEKQNQLDEAYNRLLKKCTFTANEDKWLMWGKIIRLATVANNRLKIRQEAKNMQEINRQEAIRKNIDPEKLASTTPLTSLDEMFQEIYDRIDLYIEYNTDDENAKVYATAAKQYYKQILEGKTEAFGALMFGTKDNKPDPLLKPGDIIIEYKGKPIKYPDDFFSLKDDPAEKDIKFLRLSPSGEMRGFSEILPESDVLIGLLDLWEDLN